MANELFRPGYGLGYWLWLSSAAFSGLTNCLALIGVSSGTVNIPSAPQRKRLA